MKNDGVTALVLVLIASFAIDRIVTAVLFLASFAGVVPDPADNERANKVYKLVYFVLAGVLGVVVLAYFGNVRILQAIGLQNANPVVDTIVTGLLLMGGAERLSGFIQTPGGAGTEKPEPKPIQITGRLTIEDAPGRMGK